MNGNEKRLFIILRFIFLPEIGLEACLVVSADQYVFDKKFLWLKASVDVGVAISLVWVLVGDLVLVETVFSLMLVAA